MKLGNETNRVIFLILYYVIDGPGKKTFLSDINHNLLKDKQKRIVLNTNIRLMMLDIIKDSSKYSMFIHHSDRYRFKQLEHRLE